MRDAVSQPSLYIEENYYVQEAKESFASLDLSKMTKFILKILY